MAEIRVKSTGTIKLFENDNTSSVTIASPASLGGDRTITLPDASVTLASGTMLATDGDGSSLTGVGVTEADQWRITTDFAGNVGPITANWERCDNKGSGYLGTGMSLSSGIWTFPSTGFWLVFCYANLYLSTGNSVYSGIGLKATDDDSAYTTVLNAQSSFADGSAGNYTRVSGSIIFDVTDTANIKISMHTSFNNTAVVCKGYTDENVSGLNFVKLAET